MENKKQTYCTVVKILFVAILAGVVFLLWTSRTKLHPTHSLMLIEPKEVKPVQQNDTYRFIDGVLSIHNWQLDNGARVYFVATPHLPMLDVQLSFDAGAARDPKGKSGLAFLTNQLLREGTKDLSADLFAEQLDNLGAELSVESHRDMSIVHLRTLTDQKVLNSALSILQNMFSAPAFPDSAISREINNTLIALKHEKQSPGKVASRAFFEKLYPDSPYANHRLGLAQEVETLKQSDFKSFYQQFYTKNNAVITLVGNIDLDKANEIAYTIAASLNDGPRAAKLTNTAEVAGVHEVNIPFPSEQTHILIGALGITRDDPDYYPLYVGNHILGGGTLTSRIFEIVRNQNGLAYSVYSYFMPMHAKGPFVMNCQTRQDSAQKAKNLLIEALQNFIEKGPTSEELTLAKQNLIGGYPLDFDSNYSIARQVASLGFYDLPLDTFNQFSSKIEALTENDIQAAFSRKLSTQNLLVLTVGNQA